jgi:type I restriction enzyme, S subunit
VIDESDIPEGYKATELGVLPEEWIISKLVSAAQIIMGQSPPGTSYNETNNGRPFLQGKAEFGDVNPKNIKYTTDPKKIAPVGSVLMSVRAPVGDVNIADIEYCIGRGLAAISLKKDDNLFLFFLLQHLKDEIEKEGTGSIFKSINKAKLSEFEIPLPPLPEQQAIAATLRTVQEAKEKTDTVIAATKALKAAMMKHLFTYGPVPPEEADKVVLKETEIGPLPEEWDLQPLGNISKISSGGTPSRTEPSYWNGEIPWIRTGEINYSMIEKTEENITKAGLENSSARIVPNGSLLMAMYGEGVTRGRVGITGIDASINQAVAAIFPSEKMLTPFLYYYLESSYEKNRLLGHGAHQRNLSATIIKTILVPIPTKKTQQQIVEILSSIDQKLTAEQSRKEALDILFTSLLHDLMMAKIRVNPTETA